MGTRMGRRTGRTPTNDPVLIHTTERRLVTLAMRKAGATYIEISQRVIAQFGLDKLPAGYDERYAWKDVSRELRKLCKTLKEDTEEVRQMEVERLNDMLAALWPRATDQANPDYEAVDRVLRIMNRRAAMLGLDAPQEHALYADGLFVPKYAMINPVDGQEDDDVESEEGAVEQD
jgi:hypothetical protein